MADETPRCPVCGGVLESVSEDRVPSVRKLCEPAPEFEGAWRRRYQPCGHVVDAPASLPDFLLARYAEDEHTARELLEWIGRPSWPSWNIADAIEDVSTYERDYGSRFDPARVLADIEAKRRIVAIHDNRCRDCLAGRRCIPHDASFGEPSERYSDPVDWLTLTALALPYVGHPDCREEWKP